MVRRVQEQQREQKNQAKRGKAATAISKHSSFIPLGGLPPPPRPDGGSPLSTRSPPRMIAASVLGEKWGFCLQKPTSSGKTAAWSSTCELIRNSRPSRLHFIRQVLQTAGPRAAPSVENYPLLPLLSWRGAFSPSIIVSTATSDCLKLFFQL